MLTGRAELESRTGKKDRVSMEAQAGPAGTYVVALHIERSQCLRRLSASLLLPDTESRDKGQHDDGR